MAGVTFEGVGRSRVPNIVVAGRQEKRAVTERSDFVEDGGPFGTQRVVIATLNGVADRDDELRMLRRNIVPNLTIDPRNSFAGPVTEDGKLEGSGALGVSRPRTDRQKQ